jgi:serine/threonine protein phosphatase PrpC
VFREQATSNYPEEAMLITRTVEAGDLVMLGSDGLFDNLFDTEIVTTVRRMWDHDVGWMGGLSFD